MMHDHVPAFPLAQALGWAWSLANVGGYGLTLLTSLGPILLGVAALWQCWLKHLERRDRLAGYGEERP